MKHITEKITVIFFIIVILLSASKPSMDGRALVANEGDLPSGLFAKSATYLPGDTVVVTNPATNTSIEVMIFGSYDSAEGIAIILSPEAAKNLFIEKGSSSIVRITKSIIKDSEPQLFSMSSENMIVDPDIEPMMHVEDSVPYEENFEIEQTNDSTQDIDTIIGNPENEIDQELENPTVEIVETIEENKVEQHEKTTASDELALETEEEDISELENEKFYSPFADNADKTEYSEDTTQDENIVIVTEEPEITEISDEEEVVELEEPITDKEEMVKTESIVEKNVPETTKELTDNSVAIEEQKQFGKEPNVLLPTTPKPPTTDEVIVLNPVSSEKELSPDTDTQNAMVEDPNAFIPALEPTEDRVIAKGVLPEDSTSNIDSYENININIEDYIIDTINELGSQNYYIQIATYKQNRNIKEIIAKYGEKYPIRLLKYEKINAYRIILGPLNNDEYPIVLKRFVTYGFKDAFLRKIK